MSTLDLHLAAAVDVFRGAVMVLFILSALLVTLVVLLQEGKGGGIAGAFGGAGAETFGVKAGTVNKFTSWLAALFLGLALVHAGLSNTGRTPPKAPPTERFTGGEGAGDAVPAATDGEAGGGADAEEGAGNPPGDGAGDAPGDGAGDGG